eukprot:2904889-Amphidinium_carterae.1
MENISPNMNVLRQPQPGTTAIELQHQNKTTAIWAGVRSLFTTCTSGRDSRNRCHRNHND